MQLIFAYNANSGWVNGLIDFAHKKISPQTYACDLCALTYGDFGMRKDWKHFLNSLPGEKKFVHRDELTRNSPKLAEQNPTLPAIFVVKDQYSSPEELIVAEDFSKFSDLAELKNALRDALTHKVFEPASQS